MTPEYAALLRKFGIDPVAYEAEYPAITAHVAKMHRPHKRADSAQQAHRQAKYKAPGWAGDTEDSLEIAFAELVEI